MAREKRRTISLNLAGLANPKTGANGSLFQRFDGQQRLLCSRPVPILPQLLHVEQPPLFDEIVSRVWQISLVNVARLNFDQRLLLAVDRVKMSRRMVAVIKADDDAVETADLRHGAIPFCP